MARVTASATPTVSAASRGSAASSTRTVEPEMAEHQAPVVLEFILERVTNIAMGAELDSVNEVEQVLCLDPNLSLERPMDMGRDAEKAGAGA